MKLTLRLMGGLGNQLFQVNHALKLSRISKRKIVLDTSWYEMSASSGGVRKFELIRFDEFRNFEISQRKSRFYDIYRERLLRRLPSKMRNQLGYYYESDSHNIIRSTKKNVLIQGHWIDGGEANIILENITICKEYVTNELSKAISLLINENVVSIHVRLGDYLQFPDIYGVLKEEYFEQSLERICNQLECMREEIQIVIISDGDASKIAEGLKNQGYQVNLIQNLFTLDDLQTFYAMSFAKNLICSNSTFSWWAGRLNKNLNKNVFFPDNYLNGISSKSLNLLFDS